MPQLKNFPTAKQADPNSCWACAAREIINYFDGDVTYASDQKLADAYAKAAKNPSYANIKVQQSAADALFYLDHKSNIDDAAVPTQDEITQAIKAGTPLLAIVGSSKPNPNPNPNYKKGHWIVIIGISDDKKNLAVFDPDTGKIENVAYNSSTYQQGMYWQNTSYVDK